ncbi:MAG: L-lactate dehydrogenase [Bacilli bacterium]|nr:L-lactate dehydrogenase [Bacilli bacterium]MBO6194861.1 L-lactate dehydrogenase [Bacilli bacterium]
MNKIAVVGLGNVAMAYVNALINQYTKVDEIVLIDTDKKIALGQAMDLSHTAEFANSKISIKAGSYMDCKNAKIVVITAGEKQKEHETRLDLLKRNNTIIKNIVTKIVAAGFNGIFVVATNPVDIMTYMVKKYSNFPTSKVIGTGTIIDTARIKYLLSEKLNVSPKDLDVYVLGEHGDSAFVPWSSARVGALDIQDIMLKSDLKNYETKVKKLPYKIIDLKGETSFGIGICLTKITNSIINDDYSVLCISAPYDGVYMGMPSVINKSGIKGVMKVKMTGEEALKLENSKEILKQAIDELEG